MLTSLFGRCIGVSTVVCVLLLFFFPLAQGNFQSTHGPVTAMRSKRSFLVLVISIVMAAMQVFSARALSVLQNGLSRFAPNEKDFRYFGRSGLLSILRC